MSQIIYASFDVEADGPSPVNNSMISIGISFTDHTGKEIDHFLGDIEPLPGHTADENTMREFWNRDDKNKAELKRIQENARPNDAVMADLETKLLHIKGKIIWVARPAAYDWQWLNYHYHAWQKAGRKLVLPFKAICASTMRDIYQAQHKLGRKEMDAKITEWAQGTEMTHNPLDDARFQSKVFHALFIELSK